MTDLIVVVDWYAGFARRPGHLILIDSEVPLPLATTEGAIVTARARPNPTFDFVPGVPTPYLLTQDFLFLIETAGKRGRRVQIAQNLEQAAQFDLADSAWTVVMGVRLALLNYLVASRNLELFRSEEKVREDQVAILERVLSVGEITRLDVDLARIEASKTQVATHTAEGQTADAKAALAAAIGIPVAGLGEAEFSWSNLDTPPAPESLSVVQVQRDAVINRLDIRRSLAQYAAAEAGVHSEIAKQYPNFNIGPGYTYEERNSFFTVGFSTSLPVFNRNQGPIAEAEGRRREAAAAFLQTQAQVIARSERALAVLVFRLEFDFDVIAFDSYDVAARHACAALPRPSMGLLHSLFYRLELGVAAIAAMSAREARRL